MDNECANCGEDSFTGANLCEACEEQEREDEANQPTLRQIVEGR